MEVVDEHLDYQRELESRGIMFAAGPLATTDEQHWNGEGLFVYRAESLAAAKAIADATRCIARTLDSTKSERGC